MVLDISSCFEPAQAYVMLSRVQCMDQLYILNKLDVEKIKISQVALCELERLQAISYNVNLPKWYDTNCFHIASLNCAGMMAHIEDIRSDHKLHQSQLIFFQETSLFNQGMESCQLPGFEASYICCGKGKGIATYWKRGTAVTLVSR